MRISQKAWNEFTQNLAKVDEAATEKIKAFIETGISFDNPDDMKRLVDYAYGISAKYGEAAAELACEMYDAVGLASDMILDSAVPAEVASYGDVAKTIYGSAKTQNENVVSNALGRLVKKAGVDTTLNNAKRDRAEAAWIPNGDTCAFCIMLASRGWEPVKNTTVEHLHTHCDCTYAVRFNKDTTYGGYDPDKYLDIYNNAEGKNTREKLNSMRRDFYQDNRDEILEQKRESYERMKELNSSWAEELNTD